LAKKQKTKKAKKRTKKKMVRSVVVAVDESPNARKALDFALTHVMPRHGSAQLHLLTVVPPIDATVPSE
jgi:nucleotide-binding universal stress UspA family protein